MIADIVVALLRAAAAETLGQLWKGPSWGSPIAEAAIVVAYGYNAGHRKGAA